MTIQNITAQTAKTWLDKDQAILVDVREPAEFAAIKIPGSQSYPLRTINCLALPKTDKKIIIHCQKGGRGSNACKKLVKENSELEIYNIKGGLDAWEQAGLPIEKSNKNFLPLDRQVQLIIGLCVLIFSILGYFVNPLFIWGAAFFGAGLTNAGLTGWCGLGKIIARMPWNR